MEIGRVVYVAAEGGHGLRARIEAWELEHQQPLYDNIKFRMTPVSLSKRSEVDALISDVEAFDPDLIVFDSLARFIEGLEENSSKDMGIVISHLDAITRSTDAAVLLIHHTGKDENRGARGHSLIKAALDLQMRVSGDPRSGINISVPKDRDRAGGQGLFVRLEPLGDSAVLREFRRSPGLSANAAIALDVLDGFEDGATATAWMQATGLANSSFANAKKELKKRGHITGGGERNKPYFSADSTANALEAEIPGNLGD